MKKENRKIVALATAALTLPGMMPKGVHAQSVPEHSVSYRFTEYQEEDQPAASVTTDENVERYSISVHQFSVVAPLSSKTSVKLDASTESMSGASPWYVVENDDGKPIQVMSGATIEESRDDIALAGSYFFDSSRVGISIAQSTENDYKSTSANINGSLWLNDNDTTLDLGISFSDDTITPTQSPTIDPNRIVRASKDSISISGGVSQVINKTLLLGTSISYAFYDGYLSDPYKLASVGGVARRDSRPVEKEQVSFDINMRKYLTELNAALHTDYRFYSNNWGVDSHTISLAWYQNILSWQASARLRWYDQSNAVFYQNFYTEEKPSGLYSSDYRLSAYGALSYNVGLSKDLGIARLTVSYEDYNSGKGIESSADLNPGLVDFSYLSIGIDVKF